MQKILLLFFFVGVTTILFAQKDKLNFYELDVINGLFYQPNTIGPYNGTAHDRFPGGKKKLEVPIKEGKIHGTVREWAKNGKKVYEATYQNGVQTGQEKQWYATGKKKLEISYVQGLAEGICTEWHKNGQKKSEGQFVAGKEEEEHQWWYTTGELDQQAFYKNGLAEGVIKNWYRNGQLRLETHYKNGKQHGPTIEWYADGQKKSSATFNMSKEDGETRHWSKSGQLLSIRTYDNGRLIKDINYRSGNVRLVDGYMEVFNEKESFFMLHINGDEVLFRPSDVITYVVDGQLLQLYKTPIASFVNSAANDLADTSTLQNYLAYETAYISEKTSHPIAPTKELDKTASGKDYLYWQFVSPSSLVDEQDERTVLEEHYLSMIIHDEVLSLYSVVTKKNDAEQIAALLKRLADQLNVMPDRIDLNQIAKR